MKSRWSTYMLLLVMITVWSIIGWEIFSSKPNNMMNDVPRPSIMATTKLHRDTLWLNYSDPFLKKNKMNNAEHKSNTNPTVQIITTLQRREQPDLIHLATIRNTKQLIFIVTNGAMQYEIGQGECAGDFTLIMYDEDSVYFRKNNLIYGVKLCK